MVMNGAEWSAPFIFAEVLRIVIYSNIFRVEYFALFLCVKL
jgi:hypothetical protein